MSVALSHLSGVERRRVPQIEVAGQVAKLMGEAEMTSAAVSRHFGGRLPALGLVGAYARAMRVDPGWLAFGDASAAPSPPGWAAATSSASDAERRALDAQVKRHVQQVQDDRARSAQRPPQSPTRKGRG